MANQEFRWVKSPHYRAFSVNSAVVQTANFGGGQKVIVRFANLTVDIDKETIPSEQSGSTITVKGPSTFAVGPLYKSEEAAIDLAPNVAVSLIEALLIQSKTWPEIAKTQIQNLLTKYGQ